MFTFQHFIELRKILCLNNIEIELKRTDVCIVCIILK